MFESRKTLNLFFLSRKSDKPAVSLLVFLAVCLFSLPAYAKYSGGTEEPNDPYQIATVAYLTSIGSNPDLLDKHFVLIDDIDLDPNLPGGQVFTQTIIAPDISNFEDGFQGAPLLTEYFLWALDISSF